MEQTHKRTTSAPPRLTLVRTAYLKDQIVPIDAPQIALAGRSNVGKSSLINTLGFRKGLARISATPGKTRSINFYSVDPGGFYLVDLPGYGFAQCSKKEREAWAVLIKEYMAGNDRLAAVCVLLDCRLTPQRLDLDLVAFVRACAIELVPVLTKADKCKLGDRVARQREWSDLLGGVEPVLFSSRTGLGRDRLWERLRQSVGPTDEDLGDG